MSTLLSAMRISSWPPSSTFLLVNRLASTTIRQNDPPQPRIPSQPVVPPQPRVNADIMTFDSECSITSVFSRNSMEKSSKSKIRGMPIANALAQIQFCEKKAAHYIEKVILDTQRRAVKQYGAHPLNLWVAESFVGKGTYYKKLRYHGKGMSGVMHLYHAHYFLKLKEGKPPKKKKNIEDSWKYKTRKFIQAGPRTIPNSL